MGLYRADRKVVGSPKIFFPTANFALPLGSIRQNITRQKSGVFMPCGEKKLFLLRQGKAEGILIKIAARQCEGVSEVIKFSVC